jgi:hypothetical protein
LEHGPHLLGAGHAFQATLSSGGAEEAAWGFSAAGEVRFAVAGDLVRPVGLLARLQRLDRQRHQPDPPAAREAAAVHRRCGCVERLELRVSVAQG